MIYQVKYVSGKLLHAADTLSRTHMTNYSHSSTQDHNMELAVHQFALHIPIAEPQKEELQIATSTDKSVTTTHAHFTLDGLITSPMFQNMSMSTRMYIMKFMLQRTCSWETD